MKFEEVLTFIEEHKEDQEVADWLKSFSVEKPLDAAKVMEFVQSAEGKELIQPIIDQNITKAVKTRDKVHEQMLESEVKKRVASEILKLNPQEEPWQKEIRELKEANENERKERAKDNLKRQIVEEAARQGIEPWFIEDFLPESFDQGKLYIQKIKDNIKKVEEKKVNELMASGYKPGAGAEKKSDGTMKASDYAKLDLETRIAMVESGEIANVVP
jgi:uncharacterized membrane protein YheB (UPF0754 family)